MEKIKNCCRYNMQKLKNWYRDNMAEWTQDQTFYLITNYDKKPMPELCKKLNRSAAAVVAQAMALDLDKQG